MIKNFKSGFKIFLMGGTKDSINIINFLKKEYDFSNLGFDSVFILTTTTTDYGGKLAKQAGSDEVISKPMKKDEILEILNTYFDGEKFDVFIDATHPFAENATLTAIEVAKIANVKYIRFERPVFDYSFYENIYSVDSFKEIGKLITSNFKCKNILHLAGVNTIKSVLNSKQISKKNFFVRVLPVKSSIEKCNDFGINGEHIIAMQGIFSKNFNKELMKEFNIQVIITKESGDIGGVPSKIAAAHELGIDIILVNRPKIPNLNENTVVNDLNHLEETLSLL
ncbi:MAG: precorrin-6A reductase [Methanobrevibacter sp.]|nr:precorrin-6A reductase [Methanobrevibacter sp.]